MTYILPLVLFFLVKTSPACKYTVRDIGFTDLGKVQYRLYFFADTTTPDVMISAFEKLSYAAFLDANVEGQVIKFPQQKNHPAVQFLKQLNISAYPAMILVNPDGAALKLDFSVKEKNFNETLWHVIESTVSSPMRRKITDICKDNYGVVLFIEGKDGKKNRQVRQVVKQAVKDIAQVMKLMPKPIENPPQLATLPRKDFQQERILIWSLNADPQFNEPQLAVLFGRGRRMGQVLKGDEINKENLFSLLAIVGADCECGLDRSIMLGKMIPLRWSKEIQTQMAEQLGFDVENPMIKSEMSQILSIAPSQKGKSAQNPLSVYREGIVKFDSIPSSPTVTSGAFRAQSASEAETGGNALLRTALYSLSAILLVILLAGYFIYRKNREKRL